MVHIVEEEGGYRKMIVLDDEGKETEQQYNLPKLFEVEGEFISTPPCPNWVKCTQAGHPYTRVPEGNAYPTRQF